MLSVTPGALFSAVLLAGAFLLGANAAFDWREMRLPDPLQALLLALGLLAASAGFSSCRLSSSTILAMACATGSGRSDTSMLCMGIKPPR